MPIASDHFFVRILTTLVIVAVLLVLPTVRFASRVTGRRPDGWFPDPSRRRPSKLQWALFTVGVAASGVCWYLMETDLLHKSNRVWPLYGFLAATFFFEIVWFAMMTLLWP